MPCMHQPLHPAAGPAQAPRGATLRTAMLEAGVTLHNGRATLINCRGLGTCGTCAVEVCARPLRRVPPLPQRFMSDCHRMAAELWVSGGHASRALL